METPATQEESLNAQVTDGNKKKVRLDGGGKEKNKIK